MNDRVRLELELVRGWYHDLEFLEDGLWARIPEYAGPTGIWNVDVVDVCFQFPADLPGQAPYGFYARPELSLKEANARPNNYQFPVATPFGDAWGLFSWQLNPWFPATLPAGGSNMLDFVRSFYSRLSEGV